MNMNSYALLSPSRLVTVDYFGVGGKGGGVAL